MADQETFEDELFADLYNDDEPSKPAAHETAPEEPYAPPPAPEAAYAPEETHGADEQNGDDSYMNQDEVEEDDDEVDFNLGNDAPAQYEEEAPAYVPSPAAAPSSKGPNAKEDGKMFIGGLNWETTDQSLRDYFSQFGEVVECTVMRDGATGRSRGFGFLTFKDPKTVNIVMVKEHFLDGKIIDPKRAIPRDEQERTSKIFVGGVSQETTDQEFRDYFAQFGRVVDATLMMDKDTGRPRGFGFVTFESEAGVDACLSTDLEIHGKPIEVKKAQPRGNMREEEENQRRAGKFGRKGAQGNGAGMEDGGANQNAMNAMGGGQNMTPQVMAQYMQRMSQAFAMMQQQMAMNRNMGGQMNPMMQMMQMQNMQQMQQMMAQAQGRGGPANPMAAMNNMNPQMMQQMQQMMAQQQQQQQAGAGGGNNSPVQQAAPNNRQVGYNQFDQQQQQQQQQFDRRGQQQGGYGGNQQGYNPTSWEGMYDDVPQPMMNQGGVPGGPRGGFNRNRGGLHQQQNAVPRDPNQAPPANAPTGPKNAGKPGANYRGGGRGGGNRGFHPYGRG